MVAAGTAQAKVPTIWFKGVCDTLLARIITWHEKYSQGDVYATRKYLSNQFEHVDIPVQHIHMIPFSRMELQQLVRILMAEKPTWKMTADFTRLLGIVNNPQMLRRFSKMVATTTSGMYVISLVFEKKEIRELRELLTAVRDGVAVPTMENRVQIQKTAGKGLWEK